MRFVLYSRCDDQLWEGLFPSPCIVSVNHLACLCDHMPFFQQGCVGGSLFSITFLDCIEGAST